MIDILSKTGCLSSDWLSACRIANGYVVWQPIGARLVFDSQSVHRQWPLHTVSVEAYWLAHFAFSPVWTFTPVFLPAFLLGLFEILFAFDSCEYTENVDDYITSYKSERMYLFWYIFTCLLADDCWWINESDTCVCGCPITVFFLPPSWC